MADDVYKILGGSIDLWKLPCESENDDFVDTTEFWLHGDTVKVTTRRISGFREDRVAWVSERTKGEGDSAASLLARFVWVDANVETNTISLSESVQQDLLKAFGLNLAYTYFKTFYSGVHALPRASKPRFERRPYVFCFGPKRAAIWSHTVRKDAPAEPFTEGFLFLRSSPKKQAQDKNKGGTALQFQKLIENAPWSPDIVRSASFPAYLNALVLSREITMTLADIGLKVRHIESRTGYHEYGSRDDPKVEPEESIGDVSASASGYATKLASVNRKAKMVEKLLGFIIKTDEENKTHAGSLGLINDDHIDSAQDGQNLLQGNVDVLRERLEMQIPETEYMLKRTQIQIEALFNLISQNDQMNSLELADNTKNISLTSQRDAASMKTLAYVTMFFLPGSFVSALFSTPLFTWDDVDLTDTNNIGVGTTPQFGLYWIVTVPLTVVTFLLYFLWLWRQHRQRNKLMAARGVPETFNAGKRTKSNQLSKVAMAERDKMKTRRETRLGTIGKDTDSIPMKTWSLRKTFTNGKDNTDHV